ncbi:MAG TPA: hypothetical protein VMV49_05315 [Candidatus Deferrimicrobium sp.]|nr:hypothetical protein [Candidatus Deferrimicrobium sp.]
MDLSFLNGMFGELGISFNYVIVLMLIQISAFYIKQWNDDRKKQLMNNIILAYGLYFLFFSIGITLFFYISTQIPIVANFEFYFILSIIIRGIGGIILSFMMESKFKDLLRTRYLVSLAIVVLLVILPLVSNTIVFNSILNIINIILLSLPLIFNIYFIRNTSAKIRRKLIIAFIGFICFLVGMVFSSYNLTIYIESVLAYPYLILFPPKIIAIIGLILIFFGFYGYSFFLESAWKQNLISLYIIDKNRMLSLYHKNFLKNHVKSEEVFVGGIVGIENLIKEFTDSSQNTDIIKLENNLILLGHGEKIITALIVRKPVQNADYILKEITNKFEIFFWDYLKNYNSYESTITKSEMFKPMEFIIRDLLKF